MRRFLMIAAWLLPAAAAQTPPAVDALARAAVEAHGFPSLVVGVSIGGARSVRGYGAVGGAPPTADTPYEIGSVTKLVIALALADAAVRDGLDLATPVQALLPDSVALAVVGRPVTLADLATHHAGLPRLPVPFRPASILDPYADYTPDDLLRFVGTVTPDSAGAGYAYSNVGVGLLAWLLARRDGTSVEALWQRRVLAPLGLTSTSSATPRGLAPPTGADGAPLAPWTWTDALVGAGGLRSTAADLLTLGEATARPDRSPALADALRLVLTPRADIGARGRIGLGWRLHPAADGPVRQAVHTGATFGSSALIVVRPEDDLVLVLLANRSAPDVLSALADDVLAALGHPAE